MRLEDILDDMLSLVTQLSHMPQGTRLYCVVYGNCRLVGVIEGDIIMVKTIGGVRYSLDKFGKLSKYGECLIFPSKEMRDWTKYI